MGRLDERVIKIVLGVFLHEVFSLSQLGLVPVRQEVSGIIST